MRKQTHPRSMVKKTFKDSFPIFFAHVPFGLIFGMLMNELGFSWYLAPLVAFYYYSGAVLLLTLSMFTPELGITNYPSLVVASFFVALRNVFYGFPFLERFKPFRWWCRAYIIFALVDAAYALLLAKGFEDPREDEAYCMGVSLWIHLYWVLGALMGTLLGSMIPPLPRIEFALCLLFALMAYGQYLKAPSNPLLLLTLFFYGVFVVSIPKYSFILALMCVVLFLISGEEVLKNIKVKRGRS